MDKILNTLEINTLDEAQGVLQKLQTGSSVTIADVLTAQMQLLRFVQSPTVVDANIDTLIYSFRKSLEKCANEQEREHAREQLVFTLQTYMSFMDAKLRYAISEHKEEALEICEMAGQQLSELLSSTIQTAILARSGSAIGKQLSNRRSSNDGSKQIMNNEAQQIVDKSDPFGLRRLKSDKSDPDVLTVRVQNFFRQNGSDTNLIGKIAKWMYAGKINKEKKQEFHNVLYSLIQKLDKYREFIGPSQLIYGMINRYAMEVAESASQPYYESIGELELEKAKLRKEASKIKDAGPGGCIWAIAFFLGVVGLFADDLTALLFFAFAVIVIIANLVRIMVVSAQATAQRRHLQKQIESIDAQIYENGTNAGLIYDYITSVASSYDDM